MLIPCESFRDRKLYILVYWEEMIYLIEFAINIYSRFWIYAHISLSNLTNI